MAQTVGAAVAVDAVRDIAWTRNTHWQVVLAPEGLYRRRKMTANLRHTAVPDASTDAADRAMRPLWLEGVRRAKRIRTTIPSRDGKRAGDLLERTHRTGPELGSG